MSVAKSLNAWGAARALLAAPVLAIAQANTPVVAVLYFDNNSFGRDRADYEGLGKGIAAKSVEPQTAVRHGRLLGAQYMVTGGFMSDGTGTLLVTSRVINVETGVITNPMKLQSKGDDVFGLIAQLSSRLNSELKLPALPRQTGDAGSSKPATGQQTSTNVAQTPPAKPQKLDLKTALLYSNALDEQDSGHAEKAAELYRAVLEKFPEFGPAKQNLSKVQKSGN